LVSAVSGLEDKVPDHSVFSRARNERFRDHDIFRQVFRAGLLPPVSRLGWSAVKALRWIASLIEG